MYFSKEFISFYLPYFYIFARLILFKYL